jgi:hypothetical protein
MSRGKNLQEMEVGTTHSKTAVNASAKPAESMPKLTTGIPDGQTGSWEDLGGPTPENYKPDDDSAKLNTPGASLKPVKNVVNKGAKSPDSMQHLASGAVKQAEEVELEDDLVEEDEEKKERLRKKVEEAYKAVKDEEDDEDDDEEEEEDDEDDDEEDKKKKKSKSDEDMNEQFAQIEQQIEEDVTALLSGEDLSEEFQTKAKTVFETALNARTEQIEKVISEQYHQALLEEVESIKSELTERVDSYLEYVADEWLKENALVVEQGLKTEMTESFLSGMRQLFEDHYVSIPEDRYDVLESMVDKLDEMESKLNEQIERNVALNRRLAESVADGILDEISEGLALSQKEKLASLSESVEFESEEDYREKLVTLREAYFPKNTGTQKAYSDVITEGTDYSQGVSDTMSNYLTVLQRVAKK